MLNYFFNYLDKTIQYIIQGVDTIPGTPCCLKYETSTTTTTKNTALKITSGFNPQKQTMIIFTNIVFIARRMSWVVSDVTGFMILCPPLVYFCIGPLGATGV